MNIDLIVRGICCLRPGVHGVSENITVRVHRRPFLNHRRIFSFERGGELGVWIASADLMPRNLDHRVELATPVEAPELCAELHDHLERAFADNENSWELGADGHWARRHPGPDEPSRSLQREEMELHAERSHEDPAETETLTRRS